jgi:hypothetical protein
MGVEAYLHQLFHRRQVLRRRDPPLCRRSARACAVRSYDRALVPLAEMIDDGTPILLPARSRTEIERALALAHRLDSKPILYGAHEGFDAGAQLAAAGAPVVVSLDWPAAAKDPDSRRARDALARCACGIARRRRPRSCAGPASASRSRPSRSTIRPRALAAVKTAIDAGLPRDAAVRALTLRRRRDLRRRRSDRDARGRARSRTCW